MKRCALITLFIAPIAIAQELSLPVGKAPLPDGRISAGEWADAATHRFDDGTRIFAKRSGDHVFIAVQAPSPEAFGVDLHIKQGSDTLNLHASAKLGERKLADGKYPDWQWWNNRDWVANIGKIGDFQPRVSFLPDEAKEFQLASARFGGVVQLRIERHSSGGTATYPSKDGWLQLKL